LIATITNDKESDDAINALKTEERTLTSRVDALAAKLKSFEALKTELAKSLDEYRASLVKKLDADINGIKRKIEQEKAECSRAKSELETNNILNKQMISSRLDNEKFNANFVKSQERINELKWNLESLTTIRAALDKGSYLGDSGHNDAPYSKQRMDQLLVESALTKSVLDEAGGAWPP
jgi:predicted RNase H-like nuclease (RuvC/YqgF family)